MHCSSSAVSSLSPLCLRLPRSLFSLSLSAAGVGVAGGGLRKKATGVRPWLLLDAAGQAQVVEAGKHAIMHRTGLPARDLRILDPLLSYPSTVLGRERAIVINLEHIKAIVTAQEVLLLNSRDPSVTPFVEELQRRILRHHQATKSQTNAAALVSPKSLQNPSSRPAMAGMDPSQPPSSIQVHRLPQSSYVDALRWLPPLSAFDRFIVSAVFDSPSSSASIQTLSLDPSKSPSPTLSLCSSWSSPSRISSLSVPFSLHKPFIAASTFAGSLHYLFTDPIEASFEREASLHERAFHLGPISCVALQENGSDCVSVGEDGRVNLVSVADSRLSYRRIWDSDGLVSYMAVKWASPTEFATGGLGFSLQWWDQRKPRGAAAQFKGNWTHSTNSGIVHSIDIHPSRKHTCLAGGSSGTVFAWDLRWQHQPIILSGVGSNEKLVHSPSESEVWKVQYDTYTSSLNKGSIGSSKILPAMICSEDGILAVVEEGEEPVELLAEPCAINSFDIDRQNPSDVICSLEWESIAFVSRP